MPTELDTNKNREQLHLSIQFVIDDISKFNDHDMSYRLDYTMNMSWTASRVHCQEHTKRLCAQRIEFFRKVNGLKIRPEFFELIWLPDMMIMNADTNEARMDPMERKQVPLKYVVIKQQSGMTCGMSYIVKGFAIMSCPMSFQYFPKDVQSCPVMLRSFRFSKSQLALNWIPGSISRNQMDVRPVMMSRDIRLPGHDFVFTYSKTDVAVVNDTYEVLVITLFFERHLVSHLFATFLPTALLVLITFSTFWYKTDSTSDRLGIAINCLLTLVTYFIDSRSRLPSSEKINSMDIWNVTCVLFVTMQVMQAVTIDFVYEKSKQKHETLLESARSFDWKKELMKDEDLRRRRRLNLLLGSAEVNRLPVRMMQRVGLYDYSEDALNKRQKQEAATNFRKLRHIKKQKAAGASYFRAMYQYMMKSANQMDPTDPKYSAVRIDVCSRIVFPLSFFLFNLYYWPALMFNPTTATLPQT